MYLNDFCLEIAAFTIRLYTKEKAYIYIPEGYVPFIKNTNKKPDVEIEVVQSLPFNPTEGTEVFKAYEPFEFNQSSDKNALWNIVEHNNLKLVFTSEPYRNIYPYLAADFFQDKKKWTIYNSELESENGTNLLNPLEYPMGPLLMYHLALYNNAVMIHASGIQVGEEGCLFSGFSGVGKSTIAGLWQKNGYNVINDDRLMIRKIDDKFYIFNTPMIYKDSPKKVTLNAAFLLKQHPENYIIPIDGLAGLTKLMAFCIQHHYNKEHINSLMDTIIDISKNIEIFELGFVPDDTVIQLVKKYRKQNINKNIHP